MAPEKKPITRTVETDPNYMLMFFMLDNIVEVGKQIDWEMIRKKMGLPTISATQKRWSRIHVAQGDANIAAGDDDPPVNPVVKRASRKRQATTEEEDDEEQMTKKAKNTKADDAIGKKSGI